MSETGFNLNTYVGGGKAENYCVYINPGVTLTPSANGGGNGVAGNPGFNANTMPAGAKITLYNYGTIYGGGGNGGLGGREVDGVCSGSDAGGGVGGAGGHAILTSAGVAVTAFNYGTIRAGGGGGGGGGWGECLAAARVGLRLASFQYRERLRFLAPIRTACGVSSLYLVTLAAP